MVAKMIRDITETCNFFLNFFFWEIPHTLCFFKSNWNRRVGCLRIEGWHGDLIELAMKILELEIYPSPAIPAVQKRNPYSFWKRRGHPALQSDASTNCCQEIQ